MTTPITTTASDCDNNPHRPPEGSTATLSCQHVLAPPSKSLVCGEQTLTYSADATAWHCAFSRDGQWLAACYGAPDCAIRLWKLAITSKPNAQTSTANTVNANNKVDQDSQETWELQHTLSGIHDRTVRCVAFAPVLSPIIFASASFDGTVCIWEYSETAKDWDCMAQLEGHDNEVKGVAWNATGSLLATCSRDKSVWIWECFLPGTVGGGSGDFDCIAVLNGHEGDVKSVAFAPSHGQWGDGDEIVLSASYDDTIKCWAEDAGDWYCAASLANVHTATVWSLSLAPGGGRLISCSADGSLAIYKCYSEAEKKRQQMSDTPDDSNGLWKCVGKLPNAHSLPIYSVDYAPARAGHGRIASGGGDNRIQIYREAMGSTSDQPLFSVDVAVTTTHGDVNCVCWHPSDGSILASAGDDGSVRIWNYRINNS